METSSELRVLSPRVERAVTLPAWATSPVTLELAIHHGMARGQLRWASSCRHVVLVRERTQRVTRTRPSYETVGFNAITGVSAGLGGTAILENLDEYPTEVCKDGEEEGTLDCASPRAEATALGAMLSGYAIAATTAAVVTAVSRPSTHADPVEVGPTRQARILAEGIPCGEGPVRGLRVAVYRANDRIASATTDANGAISFSVPAGLTGMATLVADYESRPYGLVAPGDWLAEVALTND